jgi:hypothetical protein
MRIEGDTNSSCSLALPDFVPALIYDASPPSGEAYSSNLGVQYESDFRCRDQFKRRLKHPAL